MKLKAILAFVGAGMLTLALSAPSFAGTPCVDTDSDGVCDHVDNCETVVNPGQRDDDLDGMGNICDPDLNQDCVVGGADTSFIGAFWLAVPPWIANPAGNGTSAAFDINEDNVVGGADTSFIGARWLQAPGPSGYSCAGWCAQFPAAPFQVGAPPASCP